MSIITKYNQLLEKELTIDLIPDVLFLQEECLKERNYQYNYLCTIIIIDIYIQNEKLDEALNIALEMYDKPNIKELKEPFKSLLDRLIYIYITKQYYQRALNICLMKKEYLNTNSQDEINRWYLELSYIHEAIGEKKEALTKLTSILESNPTEELEAVVLSNITKLYIDANNINEAKKYLEKCYHLVESIRDEEGIRYCKYLKAKVLRSEKKEKEAKKIFVSLFKNVLELERENFNYLNEYLSLLCDMGEFNNAYLLCEEFISKANMSDDLQNKLYFYRNCLKIDLGINGNKKKKLLIDSTVLLEKIGELENEITKNKDIKTFEIKEDELSFQLKNCERNVINKINIALSGVKSTASNTRELVHNYFSTCQNKIPFDEALLVILNKERQSIIPTLPIDLSVVNTYNFKNNRLYERNISYENLLNTPVEVLLSGRSDYLVTVSNLTSPLLCPITRKDYRDTTSKYIYSVSLTNNDVIYGALIFISQIHDLNADFSKFILNFSSKMFSSSLINMFSNESIDLQSNLLKASSKNTNHGLFYQIINLNKLIISDSIKNFLHIKKSEINTDDYTKYIVKSDNEKYIQKYEAIKKGLDYNIDYHLQVDEEVFLVHESASPIVLDNTDLVYSGTIDKVIISETIIDDLNSQRLLTNIELVKTLEGLKHKRFTAFVINPFIKDISFLDKEKSIPYIFESLKSFFNTNIYYYDSLFFVINDELSDKEALKKLNKCSSILSKYEHAYTFITYPSPLIRLDDFLEVSKFIFNSNLNNYSSSNKYLSFNKYLVFSNEVYASYIGISTIQDSVSKAIINKSIELKYQEINIENHLLGYNVVPNIKGIYSLDSLAVLNDDLRFELDKLIIGQLQEYKNVFMVKIPINSLSMIIDHDMKNENKIIDEDSRLIFVIESGLDYNINKIISYLSNTKCKVIINQETLKKVSIENISLKNRVIIGFTEIIEEDVMNLFNPLNERLYSFGKDGLNISSEFVSVNLLIK